MRTGQETKSRIERSALALFARHGYRGASIRAIARASDITEGALYRHFKSKGELAEKLFYTHYVGFTRTLEKACREHPGFRERLSAMIRLFCEAFDQDPVLYSYLLLSQHDELRKALAELSPHVVIEKAVKEAVARKEMPAINPSLGAALIMGQVLEPAKFVIYRRLLGKKMTPLAPELEEACCRTLRVTT